MIAIAKQPKPQCNTESSCCTVTPCCLCASSPVPNAFMVEIHESDSTTRKVHMSAEEVKELMFTMDATIDFIHVVM